MGQSEQERAAVIVGVEVWTGYRSSPRRCLLVDCLLHGPAAETIKRLLHGPTMDPVKEGRQVRVRDLRGATVINPRGIQLLMMIGDVFCVMLCASGAKSPAIQSTGGRRLGTAVFATEGESAHQSKGFLQFSVLL